MEQLIIQSNTNYQVALDNFIRAICEDNHVDNYYATISLPVTNSVEMALAQSSQVVLIFDYCTTGVKFSVRSSASFMSGISINQDFEADPTNSSAFLLSMLTDEAEVLDEGRQVDLIFHIRGIDNHEAHRRALVLEKFFVASPTLVGVK